MDAERKVHLVCLWLQDNTNAMRRMPDIGEVQACIDDAEDGGIIVQRMYDDELVEWFDAAADKAASERMCWSDAMCETWPEGEVGPQSDEHPPLRDADGDLWVWMDGEYYYVFAHKDGVLIHPIGKSREQLDAVFSQMVPASVA